MKRFRFRIESRIFALFNLFYLGLFFCMVLLCGISAGYGEPLKIGTASVDITPPGNIALWGQFEMRVSRKPETSLTANIAALQSGETKITLVSLDLLQLPTPFITAVREAVAKKDSNIPVDSIILNATHTHTSPVLSKQQDPLKSLEENADAPDFPGMPGDGSIMGVDDTISFLADKISDGIVAAWKTPTEGKITYGLDRNSIGFGRRVSYADGRGQMYGPTNTPAFRALEGMDDDDVGTIFFMDKEDKLLAILVNVACPSQVVEHRSAVNADYWRVVREKLHARYGESVVILGACSAAGDISPRTLVQKSANERMRRLRSVDEMEELARRIDISVSQTWDTVQKETFSEPVLCHESRKIDLPLLHITREQYESIKEQYEHFSRLASDEKTAFQAFMGLAWCGSCLVRYETLQKDPNATRSVEIHVVRIGDLVVCTNPFELFAEYGIQMKARSCAVQTFVVQLAGQGSYLATERAITAGHYSAIPQSCVFGPEAGRKLVDETVVMIQKMFQ